MKTIKNTKRRRTFHIEMDTSSTIDDIYMYFMQKGKKRSYSSILEESLDLFKEKLIAEKEEAKDSKEV